MDARQRETALARARAARELGRGDEAYRLLGEALVHAPRDPDLLELLADVCADLERHDDALRWAGQAIAAAPDRPGPHITAAVVRSSLGDRDSARWHARRAAALDPDDLTAQVMLASVLVLLPEDKDDRRLARELMVRIAARAHETGGAADIHAVLAVLYRQLAEVTAARGHVEAGLRVDPTHAELLLLRAEHADRGDAVAILRGLLGSMPGHREAGRALAAITWRAMMRLATWSWFAVCVAVVVTMWSGPGGFSRILISAAFAVLPLAWFGVFHTLRRQLPPGYLGRRLRRPLPVIALAVLLSAGLLAECAVVLLRTDWNPDSVRVGYLLLPIAACVAGLAHGLFFTAWLRGGAERDTSEAAASAVLIALGAVGCGAVILAPLIALRGGARQPDACWALLMVVAVVFVVAVVEAAAGLAVDLPLPRRRAAVTVVAVALVAVGLAGFGWGAHRLAAAEFRSDHRRPVPQAPRFPEITVPVLPTVPFPMPSEGADSGRGR